ncbi:MAG: nucleotidyltransferase substrate binding protein [Dysgonamonadaceae bacterium]|nr:nucleotidyltransferase substrate binding protein [Dysgonamonadaceae bacterium]
MNIQQDTRWLQRLSNFRKALAKLRRAVEIVSEKINFGDEIDELLEEGLIQRFEYTHELAWKVMKDYIEYQGYTDIRGSRDAIRKALEINIIDDDQWMESIADRNQTAHNYDDNTVSRIFQHIVDVYFPLFCRFEKTMLEISGSKPDLFDQ